TDAGVVVGVDHPNSGVATDESIEITADIRVACIFADEGVAATRHVLETRLGTEKSVVVAVLIRLAGRCSKVSVQCASRVLITSLITKEGVAQTARAGSNAGKKIELPSVVEDARATKVIIGVRNYRICEE